MTGKDLGRKYLPLFIDMEGRKVVVFGGGSVGFRKASLFAEYAETAVISIDFSAELEELASSSSSVELIVSDLSSVSDGSILALFGAQDDKIWQWENRHFRQHSQLHG